MVQQDEAVIREQARMAWMALTLTPGMGPTRIWKAMNRLGAAEPAFAFFREPQPSFDPTSLSALRTTERLDIRTLKSFGFFASERLNTHS